MTRKIRNTVVMAALQAVAGTPAAFTAKDAVAVVEASVDYVYQNVDRNLIRPYMGNGGTMQGTRHVKIDITTELFGSGTPGTPPAWGRLLRGCTFAEVVSATMVEYLPMTQGHEMLTLDYVLDGVRHRATEARGSVSFGVESDGRPTIKFAFVGADAGPVVQSSTPVNFEDWKMPEVVNNTNTKMVTLGGTYAAGVVTGGTSYCSRGLTLDLAADLKFKSLLGCGGAEVDDRKPKGQVKLELSAAQEVAMMAEINVGTPVSVSLLHGSAAGKQVLFYMPRVTRSNPKVGDSHEGTVMLGMDLAPEPVLGNDELRIVAL